MLLAAGADPVPTASPEGARYLKIASPGLSGVNVDKDTLAFISDHLALQLQRAGLQVVTAEEIGTLLGLERQRQLAGCTSDSTCMMELADALAADGILTGSVGRFGAGYQLNVKVIAPGKAELLGVLVRRTNGDEELLKEITASAEPFARELLRKTGRQPTPAAVRPKEKKAQLPDNAITVSPVGLILGFFGIEYERVLSDHFGLAISPQYIWMPPAEFQTASTTDGEATYLYSTSGFEVTLSPRWYPFGEAPSGLFAAPLLTVGYGTRQLEFERRDGLTVHLGAMGGFTVLAFNRVPVSFGVGLAYGMGGWNRSPAIMDGSGFADSNVAFLARLNSGIAF